MRAARSIIRWSMTVLFGLSLLPIINLNVERLAAEKGWDSLLSSRWDVWIAAMVSIAESPWFLVLFGVLLGGTLFMWGDYVARRLIGLITIIRPNILTSIRAQFAAGSQNVVQLSNNNIASSHFDRAEFRLADDKGQVVGQQIIIWLVILIFKKPTSYGQIIVDAGNAKIPPYEIATQQHNYAVVRFLGDIGNVALEIRCVPPNRDGFRSRR